MKNTIKYLWLAVVLTVGVAVSGGILATFVRSSVAEAAPGQQLGQNYQTMTDEDGNPATKVGYTSAGLLDGAIPTTNSYEVASGSAASVSCTKSTAGSGTTVIGKQYVFTPTGDVYFNFGASVTNTTGLYLKAGTLFPFTASATTVRCVTVLGGGSPTALLNFLQVEKR